MARGRRSVQDAQALAGPKPPRVPESFEGGGREARLARSHVRRIVVLVHAVVTEVASWRRRGGL